MTAGQQNRWLLRQPAADADALLLCLPFAGAGASAYRNWPRRLGRWEVCPVQLPGRESRIAEPGFDTLQELGRAAAEGLGPLLNRPFALFGHCLGALISFSIVEALRDGGGRMARRLFVSSARSPVDGFFGPVRPSTSESDLGNYVRNAILGAGETVPSDELVLMAAGTLRRDLTMFAGYRPQSPRRLPCPVTTVAWSQDESVRPADMAGWERYGQVARIVVPGGHLDVVDPPPSLYAELARQWPFSQSDPDPSEVHRAVMRDGTIEQSRLELALCASPGICDAAVLVTGSGMARRVVGFVVPENGSFLAHELRRTLRSRVPDWMVPAELVQVTAIPRTENGAPDVSALHRLMESLGDDDYLPPQNWAEELIVAAWEDHLPADRVSTTDEFFALGGNSLIAARICQTLESRLQIRLGLNAVLQHTTPQQLSRTILSRYLSPTTSCGARSSSGRGSVDLLPSRK